MSNEITNLVNQITTDVRSIVADEIALAKAEIQPAFRRVGVGGGLIGAAGYVAVSATIVMWFMVAAGFAWIYSTIGLSSWGCVFFGTLTAVVLLLIVAIILALAGKASLTQINDLLPPPRTPATIDAAISAVRTGIAVGQARVSADSKRAARNEQGDAVSGPDEQLVVAPVGGVVWQDLR
jgi:hypothetical protein